MKTVLQRTLKEVTKAGDETETLMAENGNAGLFRKIMFGVWKSENVPGGDFEFLSPPT